MLVLSRRPEQSIVLPTLDVTIRVLRVEGNVVRLGIEAPPEVEVMRSELVEVPRSRRSPTRAAAHDLCNRLSKITLSLHLFEKLWQAGQRAEAEAILERINQALLQLDRDWVMQHFGSAKPPASSRRCRTLIVEDDSNERELLAGLLSMNGCDCDTAADGQDALDYLTTHDRPDIVLLDMAMPRMDGREAIRAIRALPRLAGLKVFSISPTAPEQLGLPRGPQGIDAWFPKPLNPKTLWEAIEKTLLDVSPSAN
jgi:carbon storage regulator CsrA